MSTTARYNLIDGPAAHVIWNHAQYSQTKGVEIPVEFTTDRHTGGNPSTRMNLIIKPRIMGVMHEDGSGQSLIIEGYLDGKHFKGYYHARTRKGFIEIQ